MRRFARLPSRILALSAATFIGALGAVALTAAPASARTTLFESKSECVEGKPFIAKVTWTLTNDYAQAATLGDVQFNGTAAEVGAIKNGATFAGKGDTLVGSQEFDTRKNAPTLKGKVTWADKKTEKVGNEPVFPEGGCAPKEVKKPTYKGVSNCDGTLTVTVVNTTEKKRRFAVNGTGEWVERKDLEVNEEWVVVVPKEHAEHPRLKMENDKGDLDKVDDFNWVKPDTCFTATHESTCEDLKITVTNTGAKAIKATITVGDQSEEETIEPGANSTATIEGVEGLVAKLVVNGGTPQEFAWTKPSDCGGAGGGLPQTGVNAGLLAGAALVLVSGGGGLFFMARRRRVRFAA